MSRQNKALRSAEIDGIPRGRRDNHIDNMKMTPPVISSDFGSFDGPSEQELTVRRLDEATFATMQRQWNQLLLRSQSNNFFLTWEWLFYWWQNFRMNRILYLLGIYCDNKLVGIAPFCLEKYNAFGLLPLKMIVFLGTEKVSSEQLDVICGPNDVPRVIQGLYKYLKSRKHEWDIIKFSDLTEYSSSFRFWLIEAFLNDFVLWKHHVVQICPFLRLPASFQALTKKMKRKKRYNLQRELRRLREYGFEMRVITDPVNCSKALDKMIELHNKRWQSVNQKGNFVDPRVLCFHKTIVPLLAAQGCIVFFLLARGDCVIATLYAFRFCNKLIYYQGGFDPAFSEYSPGKSLLALAIEHGIEASMTAFDFLRGDEEYKWHWTSDYYRTITLFIGMQRIRSTLFRVRYIALHTLKECAKKILLRHDLKMKKY